MGKSIFITGTDTDIGKTRVAEDLAKYLKSKDIRASYYKPVQSGGSEDTDRMSKLGLEVVNTYTFDNPYSPHYASELEEVKIDPKAIMSDYHKLKNRSNYLIVEGAGGLIVPIVREDYYIGHMIVDMDIAVLLVTELRVGAINHTLLSYEYLKSIGVEHISIFANRYGDSEYEKDNKRVIEEYTGIELLTKLQGDDIVDKLFR